MAKTSRRHYVVGIDAGGSHTRCCVADTSGRIISFGFGGPANRLFVSGRSAQRAVEGALARALKPCSGKLRALALAGPHLPTRVLDAVSRYVPKKKIILTDEFELALAAGLQKSGAWGVVAAAGTGSFCKGRNSAGEEEYSGGWGPLIGDEGSGYDIAKEALVAIVRAHDTRAGKTYLAEVIFSELKLHEIQELKPHLYAPPIKRHKLAALARYVFEAAGAGDAAAAQILQNAGMRLARLAEPVVSRLFEPHKKFPLILTGGVMRAGSIPAKTVAAEIKKVRPSADVFVPPLQPVAGALIIGLESIGIQIDAEVIGNLIEGDSKFRFHMDTREKKRK